ncbi:parasitic phase-specific protein psp-1 [Colletotrichum kahawae]|uniref:Parasitic phase-specific protein psp-1 n=1 Tax=Colletotrichum kahawae TaxID=34407 RepID=A0AAD9YUZ7_COLKA|nr:parasitic phase-specific protein psp-1 [Colletotrichum kahawae]
MMYACYFDPTDPMCRDVPSYYMYQIDFAANAAFVGIFGLCFVAFAAIWAATRRGHIFNFTFICGITAEIVGYSARLVSTKNQWRTVPFMLQVCSLTVGPAFLAAGIYVCLRRIVRVFGVSHSRIRPQLYTRIFIPCDMVALVLQAVGGGLAAAATYNASTTKTGDNVMMAGLTSQVVTMLAFMIVSTDFGLRAWRSSRNDSSSSPSSSSSPEEDADAAKLGHLRSSWQFRGFLGALALATVCIFWRCVFRVAELSGGWTGPLMSRQDLFIGFESVMIVVAVGGLLIFHPGFCDSELLDDKPAPPKTEPVLGGGEFSGGDKQPEIVEIKV